MVFGEALGGIGQLVGGIAVLAGAGGKGGKKEYAQAVQILKKIQDPKFDTRELSAPELQIVGEYFPEVYSAIIQGPVSLPEDSVEGRANQIYAVERLREIADSGLPLSEVLAAQEAQRAVGQAFQRGQAGIVEDLAMRGRAGGGAEIDARMQAGQQAMELARGQGADLVQAAIMNRLRGIESLAGESARLRGQDIGLSESKAMALNRFNEWASQLGTAAAADAASARERAQFANVGERQRLADMNDLNLYQTQLENLNRRNDLAQSLSNFQLARGQSIAGALQGYGNAKYADQAARTDAIMNTSQGAGRAVGGVLDIAGGAGGLGSGVQGLYQQQPYWRQQRRPY